jgi:hypothetical protein
MESLTRAIKSPRRLVGRPIDEGYGRLTEKTLKISAASLKLAALRTA